MPTKPTWIAIKKELQNFDSTDLLELIKQLYDLSTQNKAMLTSVVDKQASLEALEAPVIREIEKAFYPPRGFPSCKTGAARKAMYHYVKVKKQWQFSCTLSKWVYVAPQNMGWGFHDQLSDLFDLFKEDMEITV